MDKDIRDDHAAEPERGRRFILNIRVIVSSLGTLLLFFSGLMAVPLLVAIFYEGPGARAVPLSPAAWRREILAFSLAIGLSAVCGLLLKVATHGARAREIGVRDGFAVVSVAWAVLALFGALPFFLSGEHAFGNFTNAYFETVSGLTTTGSSILADIESLPNGLLFWRSFTHWIGGMGIVVLAVAIFPAMGVGGYQLYRAETSGPTKERLSPRIAETAKILWGVYVLLTAIMVILLLPRMSLFDSLCQTFGAMATGGFSTRNLSIGGFSSLYVDVVVIIFTFLAGINFVLHYQALRGNLKPLIHDRQTQLYTAVILVSIVLVTLSVYLVPPAVPAGSPVTVSSERLAAEQAKVASLPGALHHAAFTVVTLNATCGFSTADFVLWPNFCRFLLIVLMFLGASAGSTSGALKTIRIILLAKVARREIERMIRPRAVLPVKLSGQVIPEEILTNVVGLFILYMGIFALATATMMWFVPDITSAFSAVAATMGGVGPGLSAVGPYQNYDGVAAAGKWVLCACMLLGRLEFYSVLIILLPRTWRT